MENVSHDLGGRLPLLSPDDLSQSQKKVYDAAKTQFEPAAKAAGFESRTDDGRLIGPLNPALYSPDISSAFWAWQVSEEKHTSLDARTRQIVILTIGVIWKADYELYAHSAAARHAGLSACEIANLRADNHAPELSVAEQVARRFTRQLATTRRVEGEAFSAAKDIFGPKGVVDILMLIGAYQTVCGILNACAIPAPREVVDAC